MPQSAHCIGRQINIKLNYSTVLWQLLPRATNHLSLFGESIIQVRNYGIAERLFSTKANLQCCAASQVDPWAEIVGGSKESDDEQGRQ